jgi:hypothetical protein
LALSISEPQSLSSEAFPLTSSFYQPALRFCFLLLSKIEFPKEQKENNKGDSRIVLYGPKWFKRIGKDSQILNENVQGLK